VKAEERMGGKKQDGRKVMREWRRDGRKLYENRRRW